MSLCYQYIKITCGFQRFQSIQNSKYIQKVSLSGLSLCVKQVGCSSYLFVFSPHLLLAGMHPNGDHYLCEVRNFFVSIVSEMPSDLWMLSRNLHFVGKEISHCSTLPLLRICKSYLWCSIDQENGRNHHRRYHQSRLQRHSRICGIPGLQMRNINTNNEDNWPWEKQK